MHLLSSILPLTTHPLLMHINWDTTADFYESITILNLPYSLQLQDFSEFFTTIFREVLSQLLSDVQDSIRKLHHWLPHLHNCLISIYKWSYLYSFIILLLIFKQILSFFFLRVCKGNAVFNLLLSFFCLFLRVLDLLMISTRHYILRLHERKRELYELTSFVLYIGLQKYFLIITPLGTLTANECCSAYQLGP